MRTHQEWVGVTARRKGWMVGEKGSLSLSPCHRVLAGECPFSKFCWVGITVAREGLV